MSATRRAAHARSLTTAQLIDVFAPPLPRPGPTAFRRLAAARPHLTPSGPGDAAFRLWLTEIGEQPPEEDIPSLYADMAELCGWPMAESTAIDVTPPEPIEKYPPLSGRDAARKFVHALRANGQCGTYTAIDLAALYKGHAHAINRHETPVNTLRKELAKLPGVLRCIKDDDKVSKKSSRRARMTTWTVLDLADQTADAPEATPSAIPEPMRVAA